MNRTLILLLSFAIAVAVVFLLVAGKPNTPIAKWVSNLSSGGAVLATKSSDLEPAHRVEVDQNLVMDKSLFPVLVTSRTTGNKFEIDSLAHGLSFESEQYLSTPSEFDFCEVNQQRFEPPITLLAFPIRDKSSQTWVGSIEEGQRKWPAKATIVISHQQKPVIGLPPETIEVNVHAEISVLNQKDKSTRDFVFDFIPHQGLVRRSFSGISIREPIPL